jgi:predicted HTH domain antitoxin
MSTVELELEDDLVGLLRQSNRPLQQEVRELIVLELYRRGTVSSGKAAELLRMRRWEFVRYASRLGIPYFDMTQDEWQGEREGSEAL